MGIDDSTNNVGELQYRWKFEGKGVVGIRLKITAAGFQDYDTGELYP
jgi:hypothetical protein